VIRSGFIEGKSPFSANNGIWSTARRRRSRPCDGTARETTGRSELQQHESAWVPAMAKEAIVGNAVGRTHSSLFECRSMILAGYDEITHINQFALGWVIQPGEDTRTCSGSRH